MRPAVVEKPAWALLHVKAPELAKTRLAGVLDPGQRRALQQAMLEDVLDSLLCSRLIEGIAVISPDRGIGELAYRLGVQFIQEAALGSDLNSALEAGTSHLIRQGAGVVAIVPGDLPLLDPRDVDRAVNTARGEKAVVVIPDGLGKGTNGLVFPAGVQPEFRFGRDSFRRHLSASNLEPVIPLELASMALDIDLPEDIDRLLASRSRRARRTRAFLMSHVVPASPEVREALHG